MAGSGCSTSHTCPDNPAVGNAGSVINSSDDEFLPIVYNNKLYFTSVNNKPKNSARLSAEKTYYSLINSDNMFLPPLVDKVIPTNSVNNAGSPSFYLDKSNNRLEMYFAGSSPANEFDKDIFVAYYTKSGWSEPVPISENINTSKYESHPFISQDGKFLIFTSDRDSGAGETDLYISFRDEAGNWSIANNLGGPINTQGREIAPFISSDGTLYYSSDGFSENTGLDIIKAERISDNTWGHPVSLSNPINTADNEIGTAMHNYQMLLSSNRAGGCGGYDIYAFNMCRGALITGKIQGKTATAIKHKVILYDELNNILQSANLSTGEEYKFELIPNKSYKIAFKSKCNDDVLSYEFSVPCSDSVVKHFVADFEVNQSVISFNLENYQIPFFVSGYYRPNTTEHLSNLRMKFLNNYFGNSDSTRYIENPGDMYDEYSAKVDSAMNNAVRFILERLQSFDNECIDHNAKIQIEIRGYADPRTISESARYADETISEDKLSFVVERGAKMNNILLSKLRAYFTFKLLESKLTENDIYNANLNKIKWIITGEGADNQSDKENIRKRRVSLDITLK